jgi:hypothetical protein
MNPKIRNIFSILRILGILNEIIGPLSAYTINIVMSRIAIENKNCRF